MGLPDSIAHIVRCRGVSKTVTKRGVSVRRAAYPSEGVGFQPSEGYAALRTRFPRHEPGGVPDIRDSNRAGPSCGWNPTPFDGPARLDRSHRAVSWGVKDSYKARCQRSQGGVSLRGRGVPTERGICRPANAVSPARTWWCARYPRLEMRAGPSCGWNPTPFDGPAPLDRSHRGVSKTVTRRGVSVRRAAYPSEGVGFQPSEGYAVLRTRIPAKEFYRCQPVPVSYDSPAYKETAVQARHPRAR